MAFKRSYFTINCNDNDISSSKECNHELGNEKVTSEPKSESFKPEKVDRSLNALNFLELLEKRYK